MEIITQNSRADAITAVLCSGGLDSAVLLADEARRAVVQPLYVSVGLAWEAEERRMLERFVVALSTTARLTAPAWLTLDMRDVYPDAHWAIRGEPPGYDTDDAEVYLPGRNIILLSKAAVFCAQHRIGRLALGTLAGNPFPDATPAFLGSMQQALSLGLAAPLNIVVPFATCTKAEVLHLGTDLQVPLALTLSCMKPSAGVHCGTCSKCRERQHAFRDARISDPTPYATHPDGRPAVLS